MSSALIDALAGTTFHVVSGGHLAVVLTVVALVLAATTDLAPEQRRNDHDTQELS